MYFIYNDVLEKEGEDPIAFAAQGFSENSIAIFADHNPDCIYFQAWLTMDDPYAPKKS